MSDALAPRAHLIERNILSVLRLRASRNIGRIQVELSPFEWFAILVDLFQLLVQLWLKIELE